jgi:CDP-diacylglycerol--serine O-phosphatidyltransferase
MNRRPPRRPLRSRAVVARERLPYLVPNLVTIGAVCAGLTSIRFSISGQFDLAVVLMVFAVLCDGIDGRLARHFQTESAMGAELDSLADFINFGVAPGLLIYLWALHGGPADGWIAVLIYTTCCLIRLARFNVAAKCDDGAQHGGFVGVPAPAGALLALLPYFAVRSFATLEALPPQIVTAHLVIVGLLMVSRLPTPSLKAVRLARRWRLQAALGSVAVLALAMLWPSRVFLVIDLAYAAVLAVALFKSVKNHKDQ